MQREQKTLLAATKIDTKITVTFELNFTPDSEGKLHQNIHFHLPDYPELNPPDEIKKQALLEVQGLTNVLVERWAEAKELPIEKE